MRTEMSVFHQGTGNRKSPLRYRIYGCNFSFMTTVIFLLQNGADHICVIVSSGRLVMNIIQRNPRLAYPRDIQQEKRLIVLSWLLEFQFSSPRILARLFAFVCSYMLRVLLTAPRQSIGAIYRRNLSTLFG